MQAFVTWDLVGKTTALSDLFITHNCCWGQNHELDLAKWYSFNAYRTQTDITALPHSNNDVVVTNKYDEGFPEEDLYKLLEPFAEESVQDVFGTSNKYISKGSDRPSLGVIKTQKKNLKITENGRKKRIWFSGMDMSYTNFECTFRFHT